MHIRVVLHPPAEAASRTAPSERAAFSAPSVLKKTVVRDHNKHIMPPSAQEILTRLWSLLATTHHATQSARCTDTFVLTPRPLRVFRFLAVFLFRRKRQATLHFPPAYWGMLLPVTVHGRVSDIWRSYFTQALLPSTGAVTAFAPPWVEQVCARVQGRRFWTFSTAAASAPPSAVVVLSLLLMFRLFSLTVRRRRVLPPEGGFQIYAPSYWNHTGTRKCDE